MPLQGLIVWCVIGLAAGWLASVVMGGNRGLLVYMIIGLIGAFVGGVLFSALHISIGISHPILREIVTATVGAIVVIAVARIIQ